jgi:hypothetical protein
MERRGEVSRREWRWVIVWIVVALIVTSVPYVIGWSHSTPDKVFGGFVIAIEDGYSYLAKMNEGARGAWLFHLVYTSEPHAGTLIYIHYLLLGKIAALSGLPLIAVYHLARLVFDALLLLVTYRFIAMFSGSRAVRRIAFLLVVFSGGLGWLLILLGQSNWLGSAPIDLYSPEAFTFLVLYAFPHIALARTLMLLGLMVLWRNQPSAAGTRQSIVAGLCWLGMGLIVSFYVAVAYAAAGAGFIAVSIARRRIEWREVRALIIAGLISAPTVMYSLVVFSVDPVLAAWSAQNIVLSPHPLHYLAGYALVGGLAIVGVFFVRRINLQSRNLLGWLIIVPFLLYIPFNLQRRLIESWQVPLAFFAAIGLVYRVLPAWRKSRLVRRLSQSPRYSAHGLRSWLLSSLLLFSSATYVLLLVEQSTRLIARTPPSFREGGEVEALAWLDQRVTYQDVVLASYDTGNYLPAQVGTRVFLGHGPETVHSDDKRKLVAMFYDGSTSDEWRRQLLSNGSISYVFFGPLEKQLGHFDPSHAGYLSLEYDRAGYQIYRNLAR